MNATAIGAVIAACAAVVGAVLSYRAATKANAVSDRKVDLEEYRDQQARYKEMLAEADRHHERLRAQLDRMNVQIDSVQAHLAREQDVSNALRNEIRALQGQVNVLETLVEGRRSPRRPGPPAIEKT